MRVCYKNKEKLKEEIFKNGYNPARLSLSIGMCRQFLDNSFKADCIGALPAKKICEKLNKDFDELFELK